MSDLLTLEPREAGTDVLEPAVHFPETVKAQDGRLQADSSWSLAHDSSWSLAHDSSWSLAHDSSWSLAHDSSWSLAQDSGLS
ncbi:hypothetical protein [Nonomuraea zeae]|uniref:hypothetical protein n=1 Tax=Nonomuraea zeae TaxID=1642303 RepID=UPI0036D38466